MSSYLFAMPEIFLLSAILVILLMDLFLHEDARLMTYLLSLAALVTTVALVISTMGTIRIEVINDMYVRDDLGGLLKIAVLLVSGAAFVYARKYLEEQKLWRGEFFVLALFAVLGMMIMISSLNMLVLYLGLELLSLSMYALVAISRDDGRATEAAMKYFVLGAIASGLLLYGMSILYGVSGTLELVALKQYLMQQENVVQNIPLLFALTFIVAGLAFKFGAVPFHMWVPDVYHGAPTAVTLFLGSAPKIAALAMMIRLLVEGLGDLQGAWLQMLMMLGLLSVVLGNVIAIAQRNLKRMFAYSTVAHMGFILMAILTGQVDGYSAAVFYAITYAVMAAGGFAVLILLSRNGMDAELLDDLKGLNARHPWYAFIMLLLLFSMAGVPPLVGFYAKLAVIQAVVDVGFIWAAIAMVLASVVGAFYYLRAVKMMYFDKPEDDTPLSQGDWDFRLLLSANGLFVLVLGIFPGLLMTVCATAVEASKLQ